jgi:hypothetical protein
MTYVINDEPELSAAANSIVNYADFLSRSIATYINILSDVQTKGINDVLVCAKLGDLADKLKNYDQSILDNCTKLSTYVSQDIADVEAADNFSFPGDLTSAIAALLAKFL